MKKTNQFEIKRDNISRIFGELITFLVPDKRSGARDALEVTLSYSKEAFSVPDNLTLFGIMDTAKKNGTTNEISEG